MIETATQTIVEMTIQTDRLRGGPCQEKRDAQSGDHDRV